MEKGKTFPPHRHIKKERYYNKQIAQESWVVIKGSVKCILYDIDDTIIATPILYPGDASFTLEGGHTYEILEEDTIVYEYKTGPYEGQELDKRFIGQNYDLE
jgi:cupin fold WbuC family metalloprotein